MFMRPTAPTTVILPRCSVVGRPVRTGLKPQASTTEDTFLAHFKGRSWWARFEEAPTAAAYKSSSSLPSCAVHTSCSVYTSCSVHTSCSVYTGLVANGLNARPLPRGFFANSAAAARFAAVASAAIAAASFTALAAFENATRDASYAASSV